MFQRDLSAEERLRLQGFTPREATVAVLAARGLLIREVATRLEIAPGTVKMLLKRGRDKLGCRNVRELTALLLRPGVITPDDLTPTRELPSTDLDLESTGI